MKDADWSQQRNTNDSSQKHIRAQSRTRATSTFMHAYQRAASMIFTQIQLNDILQQK